MKFFKMFLLVSGFTLLIQGCGGGSSSSDSDPDPDPVACAASGSNSELIGSWIVDNSNANNLVALTFFNDGTYVLMQVDPDDNSDPSGMEWGNYTRDETTGKFEASIIFDNNGGFGFSDLSESERCIDVTNDTLSFQFDEDADGTIGTNESIDFRRSVSAGNLGTWTNSTTDNDLLALLLFDDATYVLMQVNPDDNSEPSGMEWGNFAVDENTGDFTVSQIFDNNGGFGFSDIGPTRNLQVTNDTLTLGFDEDSNGTIDFSLDFQREE